MSMNGDCLAFLYNTRYPLSTHHGAPISTSLRVPFVDAQGKTRTLMIMSGRIPRGMLRFTATTLAVAGGILGRRRGPVEGDPVAVRFRRRLADLIRARDGGALAHSFMYKLDAQDSGRGVATFDRRGRSAIDWADYAKDPILEFAIERLRGWTTRVGGTLVPAIGTLPGLRSFGVHPLGGCAMGRRFEDAVVDDQCRVFHPGGGFYPGLRIVDASVVPSSLGVPPSLTIAAIAERAAEHMSAELKRAAQNRKPRGTHSRENCVSEGGVL